MFIQPTKKKRLSSDIIGQLEDDLEVDPLDYTKWCKFTGQVLLKDKEDQVRDAYAKYLRIFDFDAAQWCNYINYELNRGEFTKVEALFQECFLVTESVPLCRLYVSYVRRVNDVITGGESARGTVIQAFEFAIGKVGLDIQSGDLWNDYLEFLKTWTPAASWEQQQKVDLIRKVYKRYLAIPTETIELAWLQYAQWENEVNSVTASKFIAEKSADFMLARSWNTEWHNITEKRLLRQICVGEAARDQLPLWLNWIELEKKNNLESKDTNLLEKRILYAFRIATWTLPLVPEIWFKFTKYWLVTNEEANTSKCIELLKKGLSLNPKSLLLTFQLAELLEKDGPFELARDTFMNLFGNLNRDYTTITSEITEIESLVLPPMPATVNDDDDDDDRVDGNSKDSGEKDVEMGQDAAAGPAKPIKTRLTREEFANVRRLRTEQAELNKLITLVFTKYMVASRRSSGIKDARQVFKQGRKAFPDIGWAFFVENALLEHNADNKKIAMRILDLAFKARDFALDGEFLLQYFTYLVNSDEVDALRRLVQTADTTFAKEIASLQESISLTDVDENVKQQATATIEQHNTSLRRLLMAYISHASTFLSLDTAHSFTTKFEQLFPNDDPVLLFSHRYCMGKENIVRKLEWHGDDALICDQAHDELRPKRRKILPSAPTGPAEMNLAAQVNGLRFPALPEQLQPQLTPTAPVQRVGPHITNFLKDLPNASYFGNGPNSVFDPEKLTQLFANLPNVHFPTR